MAACPETYDGQHGTPRADGTCCWCGTRYFTRQPRPLPDPDTVSALEQAYRYHYDPDGADA